MHAYTKAICFASKAHFGQFRKGTDLPYIVHPFEVAMILMEACSSENIVCAGLLHDVIEDTSITIEDIKSQFNEQIVDLVIRHSENKALSWEERKQNNILLLEKEYNLKESLMLSCADKLSNLRSIFVEMESIGDNVWQKFKRGKDKQKWYYGEIIRVLEPLGNLDMYMELKTLYNNVFED
jgi:Guanosine polyphosphate pyrophosphohydrolases/synthetases